MQWARVTGCASVHDGPQAVPPGYRPRSRQVNYLTIEISVNNRFRRSQG